MYPTNTVFCVGHAAIKLLIFLSQPPFLALGLQMYATKLDSSLTYHSKEEANGLKYILLLVGKIGILRTTKSTANTTHIEYFPVFTAAKLTA